MALKKNRTQLNMPEAGVNLTAFMDVMIVLIFFLVKSFSVSSTNLSPPKDIKLPKVVEGKEAEEALVVSLSKNEVRADYKPIMQLNNGDFTISDIDQDGRTLKPLYNFLAKENTKRLALYQGMGNLSLLPPGKILIQADRQLPFKTVKYLLYTAAKSGYSDYNFVVVKQD